MGTCKGCEKINPLVQIEGGDTNFCSTLYMILKYKYHKFQCFYNENIQEIQPLCKGNQLASPASVLRVDGKHYAVSITKPQKTLTRLGLHTHTHKSICNTSNEISSHEGGN